MSMTLEQVRDELRSKAMEKSGDMQFSPYECQVFADAINAHLTTPPKVAVSDEDGSTRGPWTYEGFEQTAGRGDFRGGLIMGADGETVVAQCVMPNNAARIIAASTLATDDEAYLSAIREIAHLKDEVSNLSARLAQPVVAVAPTAFIAQYRMHGETHMDLVWEDGEDDSKEYVPLFREVYSGAFMELVHAKFRSGNSVPVERITVKREEYETLLSQRQPQGAQEEAAVVYNGDGFLPGFVLQIASSKKRLPDGTKLYTHPAERSAVPEGEVRLWDSQWMNIVNFDNRYLDWNKEDAIAHAVKMTEEAIARNVADGKLPPPRTSAAPTPAGKEGS